ncbi:MAG: hypothetical protein ACR2NA_05215 [Solirubrobacterales bacterium]
MQGFDRTDMEIGSTTADTDLLPVDVPRMAAEDPPYLLRVIRDALSERPAPADPARRGAMRASERAVIGDRAPAAEDPIAELRRLSRNAQQEIGTVSHMPGGTSGPMSAPSQTAEPGPYRADGANQPARMPGRLGGPTGSGPTVPQRRDDENSGRPDLGTIAWVLFIIILIAARALGGGG